MWGGRLLASARLRRLDGRNKQRAVPCLCLTSFVPLITLVLLALEAALKAHNTSVRRQAWKPNPVLPQLQEPRLKFDPAPPAVEVHLTHPAESPSEPQEEPAPVKAPLVEGLSGEPRLAGRQPEAGGDDPHEHEAATEPQQPQKVFRQCYVDPTLYARHFNKMNQNMGEGFCAKSRSYSLMYFHIPKAGSSTSRHTMLDHFNAKDNERCRPHDPDFPVYKKVSVVREPTSRFFAGYDEWFARRLERKQTIPASVREVSEGIPHYKVYEKMFLTPELTRRFELFVNNWDARDAFDDHIRMQSPTLSNWRNGVAYPMDFLGETHNMNDAWKQIGTLVGKELNPADVQQGRSFPRRFNTTAVSSAARRRICQILALDYCCLNFPLPEACAPENVPEDEHGVSCKWIKRPELANEHNRTWFIEPHAHRLEPQAHRLEASNIK